MKLNTREQVVAQTEREVIITGLGIVASNNSNLPALTSKINIDDLNATGGAEIVYTHSQSEEVKAGLLAIAFKEVDTPESVRSVAAGCVAALDLHITRGYN